MHDLPFAAIRADGQSAADHLAQRGQIGLDIVKRLRATLVDAETCHHLIEDQDRAFALGDPSQAFQKSRLRRDNAHIAGHRLDDDARDLVGIIFEQRLPPNRDH